MSDLAALLALVLTFSMPTGSAGTIDVNLSELQYLAAHLRPEECRRLMGYRAATFSCADLLLQWNMEARGRSHELLASRLRRLGRQDLADWLARTTFRELSRDLLDSVAVVADSPSNSTVSTTTSSFRNAVAEPEEDQDYQHLLLPALLSFGVVLLAGSLVVYRLARSSVTSSAVDHRPLLADDRNR